MTKLTLYVVGFLILGVLVFFATERPQNRVKGGDYIDAEAHELGLMAVMVQQYIDRTGHVPRNWNDIWDENDILFLKAKNPNKTPVYMRYSFVSANSPTFPGPGWVDESILILHNDPIDTSKRPYRGTGLEWWFVTVSTKGKTSYNFTKMDRFSVGNGGGAVKLKAPDIEPAKLEHFQKMLDEQGYTLEGVMQPN